MDVKELRLRAEESNDNGQSYQDITQCIKDKGESNDECYINGGFNSSNESIEELPSKVEVEQNDVSKNINDPEASTISIINVGYVNNAFEVGPKTAEDKGMVPSAHESADVIVSTSAESQISKLEEDNNGVVSVDLETKEKKWKLQSVGWDSNRSIIFLGLILAFDAWAAIFYCFKANVLTNIFN